MENAEQDLIQAAHARVWELLPWYHNGSLEAAERPALEAHIGACLTCTRELRRLRQLTIAVAAPANEHACTHAFLRLSAQIRAQQTSWRGRLLAALRMLSQPAPAIAGAAMVLICVVLIGNMTLMNDEQAPTAERPFQTLGRQQSAPSELRHPTLRVVLRDQLDRVGLEQWLARHEAQLVDGPSAIGVLTVKVALERRTMDTVLAQMRADQDTLFVESIDVIGTRPDRQR